MTSNVFPKNRGLNQHDHAPVLPLHPPPETRAGSYIVRFAETSEEIHAAQALRYRIFYQEHQGNPSSLMQAEQRDIDQWDDRGFHIIVLDTRSRERTPVVGTLRLFYSECLRPEQHFYTEETFDLNRLKQHFGRSLELSRFCIDPNGRSGVTLMLIWKYAMHFIQDNDIPVMVGCASFSGSHVQKHLPILRYLYQHHLAVESLRPKPKTRHYLDLHTLCQDVTNIDAKGSIPTLLRGYLKLGAKISDAAIIDPVFNSIYVAIYVETRHMLANSTNLVTRL